MEEQVIKAVKASMGTSSLRQHEVTIDTNIIDDLEFDSMDIIILINELEAEFNISIVEQDFVDVKTVRDIVAKLETNR